MLNFLVLSAICWLIGQVALTYPKLFTGVALAIVMLYLMAIPISNRGHTQGECCASKNSETACLPCRQGRGV